MDNTIYGNLLVDESGNPTKFADPRFGYTDIFNQQNRFNTKLDSALSDDERYQQRDKDLDMWMSRENLANMGIPISSQPSFAAWNSLNPDNQYAPWSPENKPFDPRVAGGVPYSTGPRLGDQGGGFVPPNIQQPMEPLPVGKIRFTPTGNAAMDDAIQRVQNQQPGWGPTGPQLAMQMAAGLPVGNGLPAMGQLPNPGAVGQDPQAAMMMAQGMQNGNHPIQHTPYWQNRAIGMAMGPIELAGAQAGLQNQQFRNNVLNPLSADALRTEAKWRDTHAAVAQRTGVLGMIDRMASQYVPDVMPDAVHGIPNMTMKDLEKNIISPKVADMAAHWGMSPEELQGELMGAIQRQASALQRQQAEDKLKERVATAQIGAREASAGLHNVQKDTMLEKNSPDYKKQQDSMAWQRSGQWLPQGSIDQAKIPEGYAVTSINHPTYGQFEKLTLAHPHDNTRTMNVQVTGEDGKPLMLPNGQPVVHRILGKVDAMNNFTPTSIVAPGQQAAQSANASSEFVIMKNPQGQTVRVPSGRADEARKQGYR